MTGELRAPGIAGSEALPEYSRERQNQARRQENFPIAAWLLRPSRREARAAIYGFCRFVDDLGDEKLGNAEAQLAACQGELRACYSGRPTHPVFSRLQPVIQRHRLEPDPFLRLIKANLQDQTELRYQTWEQLGQYCDLSANPVGQLVLALEGITDQQSVALSDLICTGLQLANMWQDVASDRQRDRRYLPQEVLLEHGSSDAEWWQRQSPSEGMLAALADGIGRARQLLRSGWPLVERVPALMRIEMATFILCGLAAAQAALEAGPEVFSQKARLSPAQRRRATLQAVRAFRSRTAPEAA